MRIIEKTVPMKSLLKLKNQNLTKSGFIKEFFLIPEDVIQHIQQKDWAKVDQAFMQLTSPKGALFQQLLQHHEFEQMEFIIAIRNGIDDEDGIWHDDGSRLMAFSLSLMSHPESIRGGNLSIRPKGSNETIEISPQPFGTLLIFLTGEYGFEHKVNQVLAGERVVIAGWCS